MINDDDLLPGLTCPAFLPVAPDTASRASNIKTSLPAIPASRSSKAVKTPESPEPMITYFAFSGTGSSRFACKRGNPRVVRCQKERHGSGCGNEGFGVLLRYNSGGSGSFDDVAL